jgi:hypothetical protein
MKRKVEQRGIFDEILFILTNVLYFGIVGFTVFRIIYHSSLIYVVHFGWFVLAYIIFYLMDINKIDSRYKIFVVFAIWASLIGRIYFYNNFFYYDKFLHVLTPFLITFIVYDYFLKNLEPKKGVVFFVVLGMLCSFEIFEYLVDTFGILNFKMQGVYDDFGNVLMEPLKDTMIDLMLGAIASITALATRRNGTIF